MAKIDEDRVKRIEALVRDLENIPERQARDTGRALMEAILELHGAGLERMMEMTFDSGETGKATIRHFANDDLVGSLLVLHGLHPDDLETRAQRALSKTSHAELLGVFEEVIRVRLTAGGCGVRESVEAALLDAVPDAAGIVIEEYNAGNDFVPLTALVMTVPETA